MIHVVLLFAIAIEIGASLALKASDGFSRPVLAVVSLAGFAISLLLLAQVSRQLPIAFTYPTWAGLGIVGTAVGGALLFDERVTAQHVIAFMIILCGVGLLHAPDLLGRGPGA